MRNGSWNALECLLECILKLENILPTGIGNPVVWIRHWIFVSWQREAISPIDEEIPLIDLSLAHIYRDRSSLRRSKRDRQAFLKTAWVWNFRIDLIRASVGSMLELSLLA